MNTKLCEKTIGRFRNVDEYNIEYELRSDFIALNLHDKKIPMFLWRYEQRFGGMKSCLDDGTLRNICAVKILRINVIGSSLKQMLCRELDLCEWLTKSKISSIFAVENSAAAMNVLVKMQSDVICTIELASTLSENSAPVDRYEIICKEGMVLDRTVDSQLSPASLYLFKDDENSPTTFYDLHREMIGLNPEEVALVKNALDIIDHPEFADNWSNECKRLLVLADLALSSAKCEKEMTVDVDKG